MQNQTVYLDNSSSELYLIKSKYIIEEKVTNSVNQNFDDLISFDLSPNPVMEEVRFTIQLPKSGESVLSLLDSRGSIIQNQTFDAQIISSDIQVENLPRGTYYLQIQTKNGRGSRSFIKQ